MTGMIQSHRDYYSTGTGKLYTIRTGVSTVGSTVGGNNRGPQLRWDYYKEAGSPKIAEWEDYLPVIKAMIEKHPVNESGQKNYGVSAWTSWDTTHMMPAVWAIYLLGRIQANDNNFLEIDLVTGNTCSILDDSSAYKRLAKFYFTANQMGLMDPDAMTQTWDDFRAKVNAGRVFFVLDTWSGFGTPENTARQIGHATVPFAAEKNVSTVSSYWVGGQVYVSVNRKAKNIDKIMDFLNYIYSPDGEWQLINGRKGVAWDLDSSGEPYTTELGWKLRTDPNAEFPNGGRLGAGYSWVTGEPSLRTTMTHPVYKRQIGGADWIKKAFAPQDNALVQDWQRRMNARDDLDLFIKNNMFVEPPFYGMPAMPDNIAALAQRVGAAVQPATWKAVYAKDEAEFNSIWAKMVSDAKGIGIDQVNQWVLTEYTKAKAEGAKYMK
jgi:putative aldouronate transport system substrate-binding protein